jgi:hypothetical protein
MKKFFVSAASTEWCGVSVDFIVTTHDNVTEDDLKENDKLINVIEDAMFDFMGNDERFKHDEDDEDEEVDCSWDWETVEETTDPEMINCLAYGNIDLTE